MNKSMFHRLLYFFLSSSILCAAEEIRSGGRDAPAPVRILVVTGGHGFEREPFQKMFADNREIVFTAVEHPKAHEKFKPEAMKDVDVVVLYDMWQKITDEAKADFTNLVSSGKGLVALHHCLASYQDWPEYEKIIGGKYYLKALAGDGASKAASTYKHDVDLTVKVADPSHPVARGVPAEFKIHDETYGGFGVLPDSKPLLTTDDPSSTQTIGWWRTYGKGRVVCLQGGHDHLAYQNANFRLLLANAIRWAARRDK